MKHDDELARAIRELGTATRNQLAYMEGVLVRGAGTKSALRNVMSDVQVKLEAVERLARDCQPITQARS